MGALAIIAGAGDLPRVLAADAQARDQDHYVIGFGNADLTWAKAQGSPLIQAEFEKPGTMFKAMKAKGVTQVIFAGGMTRPQLRKRRFDLKMLALAPKLLPALKQGDDATLKAIAQIFEDEGFEIVAPHAASAHLLAEEGVLTKAGPTQADKQDAARAAEIVAALGSVDVGQGAVVAQGLCLGVESIQGTDAMLAYIGETEKNYRPDPDGAKGVLYKAPKAGQDWRADLPAIGPDTIRNAAAAGLAGVVVQANAVLLIGRTETIAAADAAGLFLWARPEAE